jgi:hypothetical protein
MDSPAKMPAGTRLIAGANNSTEFMTNNMADALTCAGFHRGSSPQGAHGYLTSLTGKVHTEDFVLKNISLEIEFDSSPQGGLPWLAFIITRFDKKVTSSPNNRFE